MRAHLPCAEGVPENVLRIQGVFCLQTGLPPVLGTGAASPEGLRRCGIDGALSKFLILRIAPTVCPERVCKNAQRARARCK
nr:MAG TPA: hypothetical protein [Caudoviricetes sp.]